MRTRSQEGQGRRWSGIRKIWLNSAFHQVFSIHVTKYSGRNSQSDPVTHISCMQHEYWHIIVIVNLLISNKIICHLFVLCNRQQNDRPMWMHYWRKSKLQVMCDLSYFNATFVLRNWLRTYWFNWHVNCHVLYTR